jgi:hypothetical protein
MLNFFPNSNAGCLKILQKELPVLADFPRAGYIARSVPIKFYLLICIPFGREAAMLAADLVVNKCSITQYFPAVDGFIDFRIFY